MAKRVGVLLSGCGVFDGSEIHETVLTLLALDRAGAQILCLAPDVAQYHVVDHQTQVAGTESRNVMVESARIARGAVRDLGRVRAADLDALILPGGFGAAKNLSSFAFKGAQGTVLPEVKRILTDMLAAQKPIGAMCIAPAALILAVRKGIRVTIGHDPETAAAIEQMGGIHQDCPVDGIVVDETHRVVTTPAYMVGPSIKDVAVGIEKLVNKVMALAG